MPPLRRHKDWVQTVTFSTDGTMIASGSADATICVWDAVSGVEVLEIRGHDGGISSVVFSPDGHRIVSGSWDRTVRVWDMGTGAQVFSELSRHSTGVTSIFFSPDASHIISLSKYGSLCWDTLTGLRTYSTEQSDHCLSGSMHLTHDGWVVDSATNRTISKLSTTLREANYAVHDKSLAVGTHGGRVFILRFPPALLMTPDTRSVEGKTRNRFQVLAAM